MWGTDGLTNVNSSPLLCASCCQVTVRAGGKAHLGLYNVAVGSLERKRSLKLILTLITISNYRRCWFSFVLFNLPVPVWLLCCYREVADVHRWQRNTGAKSTVPSWQYEVLINKAICHDRPLYTLIIVQLRRNVQLNTILILNKQTQCQCLFIQNKRIAIWDQKTKKRETALSLEEFWKFLFSWH